MTRREGPPHRPGPPGRLDRAMADSPSIQRAPNGKRTRMTPESRRLQIIEAARQVFVESGISKTRIADIADQAGITQALVYYHFSTKEEIYQAAVRDPLDAMVDSLIHDADELALRSDLSPDELLAHFAELLLASMIEIGPLLAVALFGDVAAGERFYADFVLPKFSRAIRSVMAAVTGWGDDDDQLQLLAEVTFGIYFGTALWRLLDDTDYDVPSLAREFATMFTAGIPDGKVNRSSATRATGR